MEDDMFIVMPLGMPVRSVAASRRLKGPLLPTARKAMQYKNSINVANIIRYFLLIRIARGPAIKDTKKPANAGTFMICWIVVRERLE
jgi:hypothetical protein